MTKLITDSETAPPVPPAELTLRGPRDLTALGPFLKARRQAAGFRSAKEAAPYLGVTTRRLVEVERGERTKRGITLGKLLAVLQQLGYEIELRPRRSPVTGPGEITLPPLRVQGAGRDPAGRARSAEEGGPRRAKPAKDVRPAGAMKGLPSEL